MEPQTLKQIRDYIFEQLPELLEKDPRCVVVIEGIVAEKFPARREFALLRDELHEFRSETDRRFEETARRLDQIDRRLDQMDEHLKQVDKRLDQMDEHLKQVDKRLDQVDKRLEQMDKRLDQMDKRLDQAERRMDRIEQEMKAGFQKVDQRFEKLENEMKAGFHDLYVHIDRLGSRWGIRSEKLFRQTMKTVLEGSLGKSVSEQTIRGEQFDCVISNGEHILIEITASAKPGLLQRLVRKRQLYIDETGVTPGRFIVAAGWINSRRARELEAGGFEVVEPDE